MNIGVTMRVVNGVFLLTQLLIQGRDGRQHDRDGLRRLDELQRESGV